MKVAIYTRVASFHPHDHAQGHARQEANCRTYAEDRGWEVVDVYSDTGMSGGERARMLHDGISGDFEAVLTWDITRLGRKPGDLEAVLDSSLRVFTANGQFDSKHPADAFIARMSAGLSERSSDRERVRVGGPIPLF